MSLFSKHILKHRNNKPLYYASGFLREVYPSFIFTSLLKRKLSSIDRYDLSYITARLNHYNKLQHGCSLPKDIPKISDQTITESGSVYYLDAKEYTRYFKVNLKINFVFGDVTHVPDVPSIVRSRPLQGDNSNSVLMKLNKIRHYIYVDDELSFTEKRNQVVWRASVAQQHRIRFMDMYFNHPLCDLGKINNDGTHAEWLTGWMSMNEQLQYKFILSIEGNDVASNLRWIMSSNSIAVMPKPKFESWFIEKDLIPDVHYVVIKDDYSDLEEKLDYYLTHPNEAQQIVSNANEYVSQFKDNQREDLLSLLVLEKYFVQTGQIDRISSVDLY